MIRINRSHPLASGLQNWWLMAPADLGTGVSVLDIARKVRHATASNLAQSGPRSGRSSLAFPTAFTLASVPVFVSPLTVSCWCCPGVLTRGDLVTRWVNGGDGTPAADGDQYNLLYGSTSGKPQFYTAIGTLGTAMGTSTGSATMAVGRWHHVVGTHDGATASCYLDGVLQGTVSMTMNSSPSTDLKFGDNHGGDGAYTGKMSDVATWARCLSAADVAQLNAEGRAGYPNLLIRDRPLSALYAAIPQGRFKRLGMDGGFPAYAGGF